jgi:large subunit ribosomal protein L6
MSRKAAKPISIEKTVKIDQTDNIITVKGPKGQLSINTYQGVSVKIEENRVSVERTEEVMKPYQGLVWSLLNNAVMGVTKGFSTKLEVTGKGWRTTVKGDVINFQVGYSHPTDFKLPFGVTAVQENPGAVVLHSHDKQLLGQVCANIKRIRPVEPYKQKGIRIAGKPFRTKVRKAAGA